MAYTRSIYREHVVKICCSGKFGSNNSRPLHETRSSSTYPNDVPYAMRDSIYLNFTRHLTSQATVPCTVTSKPVLSDNKNTDLHIMSTALQPW